MRVYLFMIPDVIGVFSRVMFVMTFGSYIV